MEDTDILMEVVAPLRIRKSKSIRSNQPRPALVVRTDSSSSELSSSSSFSSVSTSGSLPSIAALPSPSLMEARRNHRARHDSWIIANRLVERAEDAFESCVWAGRDIEEAEIRLRIARQEESRCRKKVDDAALEILAIKRRDSSTSSTSSSLSRSSTLNRGGNEDKIKTPRTPRMPVMPEQGNTGGGGGGGGGGGKQRGCGCSVPCLCSAVASLFG